MQAPQTEIVIPHDPVTEQVIISAALVADEEVRAKLLDRIPADTFFVDEYRACWAALGEMRRRSLEYDPATLHRLAGDKVRVAHIAELMTLRPEVPANLEQYVDWLFWDRKRTAVVNGSLAGLIVALKDPRESPERVRALARSVGSAFEGYNDRQYLYDSRALVSEMMTEIRNRVQGHATYPFGIPGLDFYENGERRMVPGAAPGQVTLLTGVTGSGKTTFAAHLALGQMRHGRRVLYGAWEVQAPMTLEILTVIDLAMNDRHGGWSRSKLLDPEGAMKRGDALTHEHLVRFEERAHEIAKWVTFVRNPFRRTRNERKSNDANLDLVQAILTDAGCHAFVADLWARCLVSRRPEDEEEALFRQQSMLEELGVHGFLVHQQRHKDIEMRADKRPTREGSKGSGAYVEVADNMLGTHRPAQWKKIDDNRLELFILKQRYAKYPLGVAFDWNGETGGITGGTHLDYDPVSDVGEVGFGSTFTAPETPGKHRRGQRRPGKG